MCKPPDRSLFRKFLVLEGQYPELPEHTVVFTVLDWQKQVLCEFTLGDLKALKRLVSDED